jgi:DNA-binding SARP family transcriptional activator/tetratricopeptide (TPR) repeat protein
VPAAGRGWDVVEFRLLGPVEVWAAGRPVDAGQPRQRGVLAALLVDAGRLVTWDTLAGRVWGETPPPAARQALYSHVTRIRQLLIRAATPGEPPPRLMRNSGGYVLDVAADQVDLHRFRRLRDRALDAGCPDADRVVLLREALALWRGEPLAGLAGGWAARVRDACQRQRLDAVVAWAQAELAVGTPVAVIGALTDLLGEYPLVEPLTAMLMRALHTVGRSAEALDSYAMIRRRLVDELGTEPGRELREVHQAILRGELDLPRPVPAPPPPAWTAAPLPPTSPTHVPAQLPPDVPRFAGRDGALTQLDTVTSTPDSQSGTAVIFAVSGTAGVGKTTLAVHWAHRVADRFPDGQLYVNLRGFDPGGPAVTPGEAVRDFLDAFAVPAQRVPASTAAQVALYRSLLAGRRVLIVLDNARDADQVRPLLPGSSGCVAVVTSRDQLAGLVATDGAHPLTLDLLTSVEARQLLTNRLGAGRVAAEPDAVDEIIDRCARLPLALSIVAARAVAHPNFALAAPAAALRGTRPDLDVFAASDLTTDVRTVFSWSYHTLSAAAAQLFRLLGLYPGPDIATPAAASLAGIPVRRVRPLLTELAHAHLIAEHAPDRFTFHDLLRSYAGELVYALDSGTKRRAALHRVLDHYLHTARTATLVLDPHRHPITLGPTRSGVTPEEITDRAQALAWFAAERPILLAAVGWAANAGLDRHVWQLAWALADIFEWRGHWQDWVATQRVALAAATRLADQTGQAHAHRHLSGAYVRLGRFDDAHDHLRQALELDAELGDSAGEAYTHRSLARLLGLQGRHAEALGHARRALELYRAIGHRSGEARALYMVGWRYAELGDHEQALTFCQRALALLRQVDDRYGQAIAWDGLGYAHHNLGHHDQATTCYRHALDLYRDVGDRYFEAEALARLGDTRRATGDREEAGSAWLRALEIFTELGHPAADQVRARLHHISS